MSYTHFTLFERESLQFFLNQGKSFREIAKIMGRSPSTISREVRRNKAKYKPDDYCCGDRIADWLKSLGFTVKQVNSIECEITWPEKESKDVH